MNIYTVTDPEVPFVYLTVAQAIQDLSYYIPSSTSHICNKDRFFSRKIDKDSGNDVVVIIEAAYLEHGKFSLRELRVFYPNAKIVVLGSDTFYHISRGTFQVNHPADADLWLDLMGECAAEYEKYTKTDTWCWSSSGALNNYLKDFSEQHNDIKPTIDFISVLGQHTLNKEGSYRKNMVDFIRRNGYTFTRGDSDGYDDKDMDKLYLSYLRSHATLGTTSHDNGMRSAKGFRDTVGVMLGRLLFYDKHPDTMRDFPHSVFYDYNDLDSLLLPYRWFRANPVIYGEKVIKQQQWAEENTIEKQFMRLFKKYGIIS